MSKLKSDLDPYLARYPFVFHFDFSPDFVWPWPVSQRTWSFCLTLTPGSSICPRVIIWRWPIFRNFTVPLFLIISYILRTSDICLYFRPNQWKFWDLRIIFYIFLLFQVKFLIFSSDSVKIRLSICCSFKFWVPLRLWIRPVPCLDSLLNLTSTLTRFWTWPWPVSDLDLDPCSARCSWEYGPYPALTRY